MALSRARRASKDYLSGERAVMAQRRRREVEEERGGVFYSWQVNIITQTFMNIQRGGGGVGSLFALRGSIPSMDRRITRRRDGSRRSRWMEGIVRRPKVSYVVGRGRGRERWVRSAERSSLIPLPQSSPRRRITSRLARPGRRRSSRPQSIGKSTVM